MYLVGPMIRMVELRQIPGPEKGAVCAQIGEGERVYTYVKNVIKWEEIVNL